MSEIQRLEAIALLEGIPTDLRYALNQLQRANSGLSPMATLDCEERAKDAVERILDACQAVLEIRESVAEPSEFPF